VHGAVKEPPGMPDRTASGTPCYTPSHGRHPAEETHRGEWAPSGQRRQWRVEQLGQTCDGVFPMPAVALILILWYSEQSELAEAATPNPQSLWF
jgi:hypothetical protein